MSIFLNTNSASVVSSLASGDTHTISFDVTSLLAANAVNPNTGDNVFWFSLSNTADLSISTSTGVVLGQGTVSGSYYQYNNSNYQNNAVISTVGSSSIASITFYLSDLQAQSLDNNGAVISNFNFDPQGSNAYLILWGINTNGDFTITSLVQQSVTIVPPANTPVYLGNATVNASGNFDLAGTVMKTDRFPSDPHELVPRAYVDTYISSVMSYYDSILEPNNQLTSVLDRVSYLEAQLDRVYKALWDKSRDVSAIVTPHSGSIAANYTAASAPNPDLVDDAPVAPSSLTGFN